MHIHFPASFRGALFASLFIAGIAVFIIITNSKGKQEYIKSRGIIEYLEKEYQNLPLRHKGDFRYLKIDAYPYPFEIYAPNSKPTQKTIDSLKTGDTIDIYYYETANTREERINRHMQFIDKSQEPYFIRNDFQKQLGFVLLGIGVLLDLSTFLLWKKGKLRW